MLLSGGIFAQNQTPIESEAEESIDEIKIQPASDKEKNKAPRTYSNKKRESKITKDVQSQKFKSYKASSNVQRTQRSPNLIQQMEMDKVVSSLEANSPNSFEYHYFKYVAGNYDISLINHLNEAEKLRPKNVDVLVQKTAYNIITENKSVANRYLIKLLFYKKLTQNVANYAEDILLSVPQNGTLITHGFDDTYGALFMQSKGVRKDVQLISLDFLQSDAYRNTLRKKGYQIPKGEVVNTQFFKEFCRMNPSKKLAVSVTTPKEYLREVAQKMYLQGLVMVYADYAKENFAQNDFLWHTKLKKQVVVNASDEKSKQLSANYLPMLFILRKGYNSSGEYAKVKEIDRAIDAIGIQCHKYDKVQKLKGSY